MSRSVEFAFCSMIEGLGEVKLSLLQRPHQTAITRGTTVKAALEASNLGLDGFSLQVELIAQHLEVKLCMKTQSDEVGRQPREDHDHASVRVHQHHKRVPLPYQEIRVPLAQRISLGFGLLWLGRILHPFEERCSASEDGHGV
jgi:hypothetical protein